MTKKVRVHVSTSTTSSNRLFPQFLRECNLAQISKKNREQAYHIVPSKKRAVANNRKQVKIKRIKENTLRNPSVW